MRITHILFTMYIGGTETMLVDIMSAQVKQGHEVSLVLINRGKDDVLVKRIPETIKIININRPEGSKNLWYILKLNYKLSRLSPDVVHVHNDKTMSMVVKRKGVKYVGTVHCIGLVIPNIKKWDKVFAISQAVKDDIAKRYNLDATVVYNGVNMGLFSHKESKEDKSQYKFIQIGRLDHTIKGQDVLIKAIARLKEKYGLGNIFVDFYGFGPSKDFLIKLTRHYELEGRVFISGKIISHEELCSRLKEYDLLVQPSRSEGFGLTIAEGMAAKVPVMLSNQPGPMEVVGGGRYGIVFNSGDVEDCANKIYEIISNYDKYQKLALNEAYDFVKSNFDIENTAKKYCNEYSKIMNDRKSKTASIKKDLFRYSGNASIKDFLKHYLLSPGFRITVWFRLASKFKGPFGAILNLILMHYRYLFGIDLKRNTKIGEGFYIGHFSGIVISSAVVIGKNCNISQGVTIGVAGKGEDRGCPTIGNNVYIGAGAKVIGKITIGNNVAIGANAVVTKDVPDNAVVGGIPAKIISMNGSSEILNNCI
ncbi:MAG: glycosyltransferase [Muribaculaceae bacterium]|nr:glycosyltransferase [Muribaculaceae bacterium]